jgi:hypothetical protein
MTFAFRREERESQAAARTLSKPVLMASGSNAIQIGTLLCRPIAPEDLLLLRERRLRWVPDL